MTDEILKVLKKGFAALLIAGIMFFFGGIIGKLGAHTISYISEHGVTFGDLVWSSFLAGAVGGLGLTITNLCIRNRSLNRQFGAFRDTP